MMHMNEALTNCTVASPEVKAASSTCCSMRRNTRVAGSAAALNLALHYIPASALGVDGLIVGGARLWI
jgi:hypothetical protein